MESATVVALSEYLGHSYRPDVDFVDGRIEERTLGERDHSDLQTHLVVLLNDKAMRMYFTARSELRVQTLARHFRVPDVCLLRAGAAREQIVTTPPLLCIEVLSPEDTMSRVLVRVREFLGMGVPEVWVIDPARRVVEVFAGSERVEHHDGVIMVPETPVEVFVKEIFGVLDEG